MNVRKRGLALLMCICMIFTLLPFSALADTVAEYKNGGGGHGDNKPEETVYKLYIGIYIPDNTSNTIDWPNEPCVSNKTYRYVKSDYSLGPLTNGSEPDLGTWKVSYAADASQYINPTKDNFNQYGATRGADGTLGVYSQSGISGATLFKANFLDDSMKTAIVNAYLAKQNKSNEDASNYQLVPYVLKFEKSNEWHLDCVVLPNSSVTLSYNSNLPEGASLPTGVGLPDNQTAKGDQATINVKNMQYKADYTGAKPVEVTANGKTYTFAGWVKTKDATTPDYNLESLTNGSATITINSNTTLYAVWKDNTPKEYTVTYKYTDTVPDGANALLPVSQTVTENTEVTVADNPTLDGYDFIGWTPTADSHVTVSADGEFTMPGNDVVFEGTWVAKNDLSYTVHHYWNGTEEKVYDDETVTGQTFNTTVTVNPKVADDNYTPVSTEAKTVTITTKTEENVVTFYYYKNVELTASSDERLYNGDDQLIRSFDVCVPADNYTDYGRMNYTFLPGITAWGEGKNPGPYPVELYHNGTKIDIINFNFVPFAVGNYWVTEVENGTLTITAAYQVHYEYKNAPANAPACPTDEKYYADGTTVTLEQPGTAPTGYKFLGWKVDGTGDVVTEVTIDKADVKLVGEWAPVTGLSYVVHYYWAGTEDKVAPDKTVYEQTFGTVITSETPIEVADYKAVPDQVSNLRISTENEKNVITFYYYKNIELTANNGEAKYDGTLKTADGFKAIVAADNGADIYESLKEVLAAHGQGTDADKYIVHFVRGTEIIPVTSLVDHVLNDQYWVTKATEGELIISPRSLIITSASDSKYYDGTPLTNKTITVTGDGFVAGEGATYNVTGSQTEIDSSKNTFDVIFNDNTKATNYAVEKKLGDLTVKARPVDPGIYTEITVEITGNSDSVVYDGAEHSVKDYTVKISDSRYTEKDFTFTGKAEASGVNAGTYEMGLKSEQFRNTNALFKNVKFVIKADGVLTITPMDLTITAGSKDGIAPVTCNEYENTDLAKGDVIESVKITGEQLEPGQSPNVASDAVIKNAKGEDVTKNYNIKYVDGTLKAVEPLNKEDHFNYIVGYTDGTIRPNNNITRAEVAAIFFRLLTDEARSTFMTDDCSFSDVAQGAWCRRSIATLTNAEIISGYTDGTFKPNAPITRAELATIIARFAKLDVNTKTFSDINGHWAQKYIELAAGNGWIDGYTDGTFRPNQNIKRAETFAMINRVLDRVTKSNSDLLPTDQMNMWSDNMDFDAWYYRDVQEATNNHKAERVGDSIYEKWTEKLPDIDWAAIQL